MLKARVKLIYYFGLLCIIGLHLNLVFNELEFPHPAEYIHTFSTVIASQETGPLLVGLLHLRSHNQCVSHKIDMGYSRFPSRKGFVDNNRINSIGVLKSKCALE